MLLWTTANLASPSYSFGRVAFMRWLKRRAMKRRRIPQFRYGLKHSGQAFLLSLCFSVPLAAGFLQGLLTGSTLRLLPPKSMPWFISVYDNPWLFAANFAMMTFLSAVFVFNSVIHAKRALKKSARARSQRN